MISAEDLSFIIAAVAGILGGIANVFASGESVKNRKLAELGAVFRNKVVIGLVTSIMLAQSGVLGLPDFTYMSILLYFEAYLLNAMGLVWGLPKGAGGIKGGLLMLVNALRGSEKKNGEEGEGNEGKGTANANNDAKTAA